MPASFVRRHAIAIPAAAVVLTAVAAHPALAQSSAYVAPPRNISDITAILDQQKPDANRTAKLKADADAAPAAGGALGPFYFRRAQARAALGRNRDAIADSEKAIAQGGDFLTEVSRYQQFMAVQYRLLGDVKRSIEIEQGIVKRFEQVPRGKGRIFNSNLRIVVSYLINGDLRQAEVYVNRNQALLNESKSWPNVDMFRSSWEANVEDGRARLLSARGKFREAELGFRKAQALLRDAHAKSARWPNKPPAGAFESGIDFALNFEGQAKARQGRLAEAEADIRRAMLSRLKTVGKYHPDTAQITVSLANLLVEQARFAEAEQLSRTAADVYRTLGYPEEATVHAFALNQLAATLFSQRKWDEAADIYDRLDAATKNWEETRAARIRLGFARIFTRYFTQKVDVGIDLARQLVARETKRVGLKHFDAAMAVAMLGAGLTYSRRDGEALAEFKKALPILLTTSRDDVDDSTTFAAAENRLQVVVEAYLILLSRNRGAVADAAAESFRLSELVRGRSVQKALAASSARALAKDPALAELARKEQDLEKQISADLGNLNNMLALPPAERDDKAMRALQVEVDKLRAARSAARREIARKFPNYADLVSPQPSTVDDIRAALRPDEAFLSIWFGRRVSFVWAVPKQGRPAFALVQGAQHAFDEKVRYLRAALDPDAATISDIPPFDLAQAHELYTLLLKPVEAGWKSAKSLIVVTNGALGLLPLGLLPTTPAEIAADSQVPFAEYRKVAWLARTHAVTSVPSAAALRTLRSLPAGSASRETLVGFGDPYFNAEQAAEADKPIVAASAATTRGISLRRRNTPQTAGLDNAELGQLPRLPDTADELKSIALALKLDPGKAVHLGKDANERTVRGSSLARYRIVVFATHGLMPGDLTGLTQPALALTAPSVAGVEGDGLLRMEEILALRLDADWVVLSACNTGAGAVAGAEAASGLGRAFFYAGTRALLLTNWSVHSASARDLVTDLFRRQAANPAISRAEALRQASMAVLDGPGYTESGKTVFSYAHPLFWAPYTIIGDGG
jgi:CHAT domain-containing protein